MWQLYDESTSLHLNEEMKPECAPENDRYNISVSIRFKPESKRMSNYSSVNNTKKAILPLHQRLALIKVTNDSNSNRDAINILRENGEWFKEYWKSVGKKRPNNSIDSIAANIDLACGIHDIDEVNGRIVIVDATKGLREFKFDQVFNESSTQASIYDSSVRRLVCDFINGFNATCLVYGQTGSGKTYTMFGPNDEEFNIYDSSVNMKEKYGIVPHACEEIFEAIEYRKHNLKLMINASVSVCYIEIFGNDISDLLQKGKSCSHSKVAAQRFVLNGASEVEVSCLSDIMHLLCVGEKQKRKAQTAMNERSSRAHSIFIITLNQECMDSGVKVSSKFFFADLGGSEQTKKNTYEAGKSKHCEALKDHIKMRETDRIDMQKNESNFEQNILSVSKKNNYSTGFVKSNRMREAVYINLGLLSLKQCVEALKNRKPYVPYAASKLTMLLSSGLGGNSKTSVIVCAGQNKEHTSETLNAMRFGEACSQILKTARTAANMVGDILVQIEKEILICEQEIKRKERWEISEEKRVDKLNESETGKLEYHKTAILVGAEDDRQKLNQLLRKKAKLTGDCIDTNANGEKIVGHIGFGNANDYGFGKRYDASVDKINNRFEEIYDRSKFEKSEVLTKFAKTIDRNKLMYAGISE